MIKTVAIVSLSRGILGEAFVQHEVALGLKRLKKYGLKVKIMPNALRGMEYLQAHPEARAADLLWALRDPEVDMILTAIGGEDTYRLLPYLFEHDELQKAVNQKIFLGFSDTTTNHFMLHKVGLNTFYGQAFLPDVCELDAEMLPYTAHYFEELIRTGTIREICPSEVWYDSRTDFSAHALGTATPAHPNEGFQLLQGVAKFSGEILGGCVDTMYDYFNTERHSDSAELCRKYGLFPSLADWQGKILLLETSEEQPTPQKYRSMLRELKSTGLFGAIAGILAGKPMDEKYAEEYKKILQQEVGDPNLPVLWNVNIGHATPRCIIPFGVPATVDALAQKITFG